MSSPYRDNDDSDVESRHSSMIESIEHPPLHTKTKWFHARGRAFSRIPNWGRRAKWLRIVLVVSAVLGFLALIASIGLQHIVDQWKEPDDNGAFEYEWTDDFSRDIVAKNCHSHNDYWRSVPLYEALANGCVGIEADIWVTEDKKLLVSHSWMSTRQSRTLGSLYLDPLVNIFTHRNVSTASTKDKDTGVFDTDPNTSIVLLIDFKNDAEKTWPILLSQLEPLRAKNWLTYFDGSNIVQGPLTVVGTGITPFDRVQSMGSDRYIFFDAPLDDVDNPKYNSTNSYYASVQMGKATGRFWFNKVTSKQVDVIRTQIESAAAKGFRSRYWDTPSWPISLRDKVWFTLTDNDVGMLNVDDLVSATRWNWNWCVIAGLALCGNS
ncbi:hypothetical protein EJ04DRAFT_593400 [Polyplosphaeria fusca]|uniref:Altered inheritance of mitochondria protein 6 n=1 Tax=Polyplosphaeria fusca TaxID=682080 RepID=A0A9P4UWH8_9PLEO|nr:hypothetical protein EJ04DRAFT_593400 [Polyplosphaeria fusca]